jgi:hypothetical protein
MGIPQMNISEPPSKIQRAESIDSKTNFKCASPKTEILKQQAFVQICVFFGEKSQITPFQPTLLPMELKRYLDWKNSWSDPSKITELDYIGQNLHPEDVLILQNLLFPDFIKVGDCIFLPFCFDEEFFSSLNPGRRPSEIEKMINSVKLFDLFAHAPADFSEEGFEQLGKMLQKSWKCSLKSQFPEHSFEVELLISDQNYGPILYVYQVD